MMFKMLVFTECLYIHTHTLDHFPVVFETIVECLKVPSLHIRRMAASAYSNLLVILSNPRLVEECCLPIDWDVPFEEVLPVRYWGSLINGGWSAISPKWYEPGEMEKKAISTLLDTILLEQLKKIEGGIRDGKLLEKDELRHSLFLVQESINAGNVLPFWEEEPIILEQTNVERDTPQLVLASKPISVEFSDESRPSNIRKAITETCLSLGNALLESDSDNTKAFDYLINTLWLVQSYHTTRKIDFERSHKSFGALQKNYRNNLIGTNQYWFKVRPLMLQRAMLQHYSRTIEMADSQLFSATNKQILEMSLRFSTSNYSGVRKAGQQLLNNMCSHFQACAKLLVDPLVENLALDPVENHKIFKGNPLCCIR